mmetsp:Transcript_10662/g.33593  ORF Transcript_10662/g.33593 Transcript_10662/m.33593 type:complete len:202 (-) Transcript_10662:247-852(-)
MQIAHNINQCEPMLNANLLHARKRSRKVVREQRLEDALDVFRLRLARARVHRRAVDARGRHGRRLQHVEATAHVAMAEADARFDAVGRVLHALRLGDLGRARRRLRGRERCEAEARAARLERGDDLVAIVADQAEARVARELLHHATQRHLRRVRHRVRLVEHDELGQVREHLLGARKVLDALAHDIDAAVVRGVQLENHG